MLRMVRITTAKASMFSPLTAFIGRHLLQALAARVNTGTLARYINIFW
ncbi:hypothetical protein [Mangrovibacter yixingensis]|nr:hypothetical protein [Mangrovibacter yixingensis]